MRDEVEQSVLKLEAMAAVSPALAPVVSTALSVVRSAEADVRAAETRAALAEELVKGVRPELDAITKRAEDAERRLAERDEIDAAEDARKSRGAEAVSKAEERRKAWTPSPAQVAQISEMAGQVAELAEAAKAAQRRAVELITVIHKAARDADGRSPLQNWHATKGGPWTVSSTEGPICVVPTRADAIQAVKDILDEEWAQEAKAAEQDEADERYHPRDEMHRPEPWRRRRPARVEQPPSTAPIETGVSKRRKKQARIM